MTTESHMTFTPNLVVCLGIAGLGIVLILDRLGMVAAQDVLRFWPVLLILFGASVVAQALRGGAGEPRRAPIVSPGFIFFIASLGLLFSRGYQRGGDAQGETGDATTESREPYVVAPPPRLASPARPLAI